MTLRLATGFESTLLPAFDVDVTATSGHARRWRDDLRAVRGCGVSLVRYPVLWHRVESERGRYDWAHTDAVLQHFRDLGMEPVVDLVHHTSYPRWLAGGFRDAGFGASYLAFVEAFARRYPDVTAYTLFNEPFATLFLAGHEALWPPYGSGTADFVAVLQSVLPALTEASRIAAELLPRARHVWVDTCEHHAGTPGAPAAHAALANDRRFVVLDLFLGRDLDEQRPFLSELVDAGGEALLDLAPGRIDVLGLDYYAHSEWYYADDGAQVPSPAPRGLAALAAEYAERYAVPVALTETNLRGFPSDRASWLRYTLEQCEQARARGVDLRWYCWYPFVDSCDWDSLLARPASRVDPVGLLTVEADGTRRPTSLTRAWAAAASGAAARELPAYRLQEPVAQRLAGFLPQMAHWDWQDPPGEELVPPVQVDGVQAAAERDPVPTGGPASGWSATAETYHRYAVGAAVEGLRDPALGATRLVGAAVGALAEAAVTSATPFVRAPVLAVLSAAAALHTDDDGRCGECQQPHPCRTARALGLDDAPEEA